MADNYLEKRYKEVFGKVDTTDPETGYDKSCSDGILLKIIRKYGKRGGSKK